MKLHPTGFVVFLLITLLLSGCGNSVPPSQPLVSQAEPTLSSSASEPTQTPPESSSSIYESASIPSESSVADSPVSQSPLSSQKSASSTATPATVNPFALDPAGEYDLYSYNAQLLGYTNMGYAYWTTQGESQPELEAAIAAINNLPLLNKADTTPVGNSEYGLMSVARDGSYAKTQFFLYQDVLTVNGTAYSISAEQYDELKRAMEAGTAMGSSVPLWFVYMNPNRVVGIRCQNKNGEMQDMRKDNLGTAASELQYINVSSGKTYQPGSKALNNSPFQAVYTFDNGVTYTLYVSNATSRVNGVTLYVESSDMNYACEYKVDGYISDYIESTQGMIEGPANPRTGKPVIYLYPERTQNVSVQLDFAGRITYTYPAYRNGWNVTASPSGTLVDQADGSTHYYLFWEGNAHKTQWDFSEGFVVPGAQVERFLLEKLPQLGLTPREYNDFITYWAPELAKNSYNLITFATDEYDEIAKLHILPKPDTILRVHMVWKAIPAPIEIREQKLPALLERKGFTVVEWGGTRAC